MQFPAVMPTQAHVSLKSPLTRQLSSWWLRPVGSEVAVSIDGAICVAAERRRAEQGRMQCAAPQE